MSTVSVRRINQKAFDVTLEGMTPLLVHRFGQKAIEEMRIKQQTPGQRKKIREVRNPEAEYQAAKYTLEDGTEGVSIGAIKNAMCAAAHRDLGVAKTLVRSSVFIECDGYSQDGQPCVRILGPGSKMREDVIRVSNGAPDLRYRPEYREWEIQLRITYNEEAIGPETIVNLLERAGFGVGLGDWRPERDGEFGRFRVQRQEA